VITSTLPNTNLLVNDLMPVLGMSDYFNTSKHQSTKAFSSKTDVEWWIENRRQDYYGMNSIDCAGAINDLRILGNTRAQLIGTTNKGFRENGTRHPHSWSGSW